MDKKQKIPTMKDVAEMAGCSIQTVSAVLNGKPEITQETRERVLQHVQTLGYRRGSIARSLRTGKTNTIALLVSDIANPSFSTMASAAEDYAHDYGYNLEVYNTHDDVERETRYIHRAIERWVDGLLFVSAEDRSTSLEQLQDAGIPTVAVDRIPEGYTGFSVTLNNRNAGAMAAEHLLDLGHTCFAHIGGPGHLRLARERLAGFQEYIETRNIQPGLSIHVTGDWGYESGYQAMKLILQSEPRPSAVFAANDRMALGAIRAIREVGLVVPDDFSIIGLDDIEVAGFACPPLTTVRQSFAETAKLSMQLLFEVIKGKEPEQKQIITDPTLVVRKSTASMQA